MGLKDFYLSLEDKYYSAVEKTPLVKLTDKIDQIIPSFALLIGLIILIILLAGYFLLPPLIPGKAEVTIIVKDELENPLSGVEVVLTYLRQEETRTTPDSGQILLEVPLGTTVKVEASAEGFETRTRTFDAVETEMTLPLVLVSLVSVTKKTITLNKPDLSLFEGRATVTFQCENRGITPPSPQTVTDGIVEVIPDPNCGNLLVNVNAGSYRTLSSRSIAEDKDSDVIYLSEYEQGKGDIVVNVENEAGEKLSGMEVKLYSDMGLQKGIQTVYQGSTKFSEVVIGRYYVSVSDPNREYALAESGMESVSVNQTTVINIVMTKTIKGTISVTVLDKAKERIPNATVKLYKSLLKPAIAEADTKTDGETVYFDVRETIPYYVRAYHEEYLSAEEKIDSPIDNPDVNLTLEKLTPENSGLVLAEVEDEDGAFVEGAQVFIYDSTTDWLYPREPKWTDANGEALFKGVKPGNYYLKAIKGTAEAVSEKKTIDVRVKTLFPITIERGNGTVRVTVVDLEGDAIQTAKVEFNPLGEGERAAILTDATGVAERTLKANQRAYVRVSKEGYAGWVSEIFTINPNEVVELKAELEVTIPGEIPTIILRGFFESETALEPVTEVKAGTTYIAKLQVKVPQDADLTELGVHLRTGATELMQKDNAFIKDVGAADAITLRYTSFNPPTGWLTDATNKTEGDAKWVNILFRDLRTGIYNLSAEVRVKKEVVPGDAIPFYYRVWGEAVDGRILRTPADIELGTARSVSSKDELYAKAYEKIYWEGMPALCDKAFCYSGERVLDLEDQIYKIQPYQVALFGRYQLSFDITNNSDAVHDKAEIRIKNVVAGKLVDDVLEINSYSVVNADGQEFSREGIALYKLDPIPLGYFIRNASVTGDIVFTPKKLGTSNFELVIISEGREVFRKEIAITVLAEKEMIATLTPELIPAFTTTSATLEVVDGEGFAVQDVRVMVTKITQNNTRLLLGTYYTNANGRTQFDLPSSTPGSRFLIEAEKTGYESQAIERIVSTDIISFDPQEFVSNLDTLSVREETLFTRATNLIPTTLTLEDAYITGYFKGYLNEGAMEAYLQAFVGTQLKQGEEKDLELLKTALVTDVDTTFLPDSVNGTVNLIFKSEELGQSWGFALPFTTNIEIGKEVAVEECLILDGLISPLETITQGETVATSFTITNTCESAGRPVTVENLKAKVKWLGNRLGTVKLRVSNEQEGEANLVEGEYRSVLGRLEPTDPFVPRVYNATLYFTPLSPEVVGQTAEFEVEIAAELPVTGGIQEVKGNKKIKGSIAIINLAECIKITPDPEIGLVIERDAEETKFEIDPTPCGTPMDIIFCSGDPNCKGGKELEGGLLLTPEGSDAYPIYDLKEKKEIKVSRLAVAGLRAGDIPGMYGITITARPQSRSWYPEVKTINVLIKPRTRAFFELDRYTFTIPEEGSIDSTTLYNEMYQEDVEVTASARAWKKSTPKFTKTQQIGYPVVSGLTAHGIALAAGWGVVEIAELTTTVSLLVSGPGIALGIAIALGTALYLHALEERQRKKMKTYSLPDYVINFVEDFEEVNLYHELIDQGVIDVNLVDDVENVYQDPKTKKFIQTVGLSFENKGVFSGEPVYGVLSVKVREHVHGDPAHAQPKMYYGDHTGFAPYNVKDSNTTTYIQKFHLRFRTMETEQALPPLAYDVYDCSRGALSGRTGSGANPRIKLDWSWDVGIDECDASNPNAVYCDATQFSIMLAKRMMALHKFLEANDYFAGVCPPEAADDAELQNNQEISIEVPTGQLGISELKTLFTSAENDLSVFASITNKTTSDQTAQVTINLSKMEDDSLVDSCDSDAVDIPVNDTVEVSCEFKALAEGAYYATAILSSPTTTDVNEFQPIVGIMAMNEPAKAYDECWLARSTKEYAGEPIINKFYKEYEKAYGIKEITYEGYRIRDLNELNRLLKFDAYLIKDGFSQDFRNDFVDYYTKISFTEAATPDFYNPTEEKNQLKDYFLESDRLVFSRKYAPMNYSLPTAGTYKVEIQGFFADDWSFYDDEGKPNALFIIEFYHFQDPVYNSPFYSLPFDGLVGLEGASLERQGYGVGYENIAEELTISQQDLIAIKTLESPGSNPVTKVTTDFERDFRKLNSLAETRGNLLYITPGFERGSKKIIFSPAYATPVMLKFNHDLSQERFSVFYGVSTGEGAAALPIDVGPTLTYWSGCGACLDFTGIPVTEAFDYKPDRAATTADRIQYWENAYAVDWPRAVKSGNVFLRTIFYTPEGSNNYLNVISPLGQAKLTTPDEDKVGHEAVALNGISTMEFNRPGNLIRSVQNVLDLVAAQKVCVTDTGITARYWWNPKIVYTQSGSQTNIHVECETLDWEEGECIGYSP